MTNNKRRFDLHNLVDLMEDGIEKLSKIGKKFEDDDPERHTLRHCLRNLYDAHDVLDQECLEHEAALLEIVIRMVEEEIQDATASKGI
jgi:hypothetical protein